MGAFVGAPATSKETLAQLLHIGFWNNTMRDIRPKDNNGDLTSNSLEELIRAGYVATDLEAMSRPEFTARHARQILARYDASYGGRRVAASAYVVGRIVQRYGAAMTFMPEATAREPRVALTRIVAATWLTPVLEYPDAANHGQPPKPLQEVATILGDEPKHWEMFFDLLRHWHGSTLGAAQAAKIL